MIINNNITVIKLNVQNRETFRYSGQVLALYPDAVVLQAFFNRPDLSFHGITMANGDRFIEIYFHRRWYNVLEIHDRQDDHLKGWYCNVTMPARITSRKVAYVDLALDLLVFPDGQQLVLDEDEFQVMKLDEDTRNQASATLKELQDLAAANKLSPLNRQNWS
jgi:uncharacterized protein